MERYHEIASKMDDKHRWLYLRLGAQVQSAKTCELRFKFDANKAHDIAQWALEQTGWKSVKAARCLLSASRMWQ